MEPEEQQGEQFDPLSDPEERRVLYAALDSFRYAYQSLLLLTARQLVDITTQAVSPCSALQRHTPQETGILFPPFGAYGTIVRAAFRPPCDI